MKKQELEQALRHAIDEADRDDAAAAARDHYAGLSMAPEYRKNDRMRTFLIVLRVELAALGVDTGALQQFQTRVIRGDNPLVPAPPADPAGGKPAKG